MSWALIALVIAVSVLGLAQAARSLWATARDAYRARFLDRHLEDLAGVFLFLAPRSLERFTLALALMLAFLGGLLAGAPGAVVGLGGALILPTVVVAQLRARRRAVLDRQWVDVVEQLSGLLQSGIALPQAIVQLAAESPVPLSQELGLVSREMQLGVAIETALASAAERNGSEEMALVATCIGVARSVGGPLAENLQSLAAAGRERRRIEGRIDTLTSQGRLQGRVLALLPPVLALLVQAVQPALWEPLFAPGGRVVGALLATGVVLLDLLGLVWIRRIVRIEV